MFFRKLILSSSFILTLWVSMIYPQAYSVIPGGESVGLVLNYSGIAITDTYVIEEMDHYDPGSHGFKKGDIITHVNDINVKTIQELINAIEHEINSNVELTLTVSRQNENFVLPLKVYYDSKTQTYSTGLYVKDQIVGIGTITYYNPETKGFGALGHALNDPSLSDYLCHEGKLYESYVLNIVKSQNGQPGEKIAKLDKNDHIGNITENNMYGVFGYYDEIPKDNQNLVETASIDEIECGPAYFYTVINGNQIEKFDITITDLKKQDKSDIKGITFTINDKSLLEKTNGIVQGMSGSPIFQNGKMIGCVTHVCTNDVMDGYGLYIEWMIENSSY